MRSGRLRALAAGVIGLTLWASGGARAGSGEEQIPVGPRPLALGGAFTAVAEGTDALYWNPAGLARLRVSSLRGTTADLHGLGIRDNVLTLVSPVGSRLGIGLEWYHSGYDDGSLEDSLNRLNLGLGWQPHSRMLVGASLKYRQYRQTYEGADQGRGSGTGLDLGARVDVHRKLALGLTWRDAGGSTLEFDDGSTSRPFDGMLAVGAAVKPHPAVLLTSDLDRDFHAGAEVQLVESLALRAGWSKDLEGIDGGRFSAGLGVRVGPVLAEYTFQDHPMLEATHRFGLGIDFTLAPQLVSIDEVELEPLFASFYKSYAVEGPGTLVVTNLHDEPVEATIRLDQTKLLDQATERTVYLRPGVTQAVTLPVTFPSRVTAIDELQPVPFTVEVVYQSAGRRRTEKRDAQTFIYGVGTLDWSEGVARAAAFVTPTHPLVDQFTREIVRSTSEDDFAFLNRSTSLAARLFDGMSACGLTYTPDPLNPYAEVRGKAFAVDTIQYPAELLVSRTGDCDDSTVLYASMLANVGVRSAFVDVPGHIFLMFDTGIHGRDRDVLGVDPALLVEREGSLWIPVETTSLGQPFHVAWQRGAELVRRWEGAESYAVVDVLVARQRFDAAVSAARVPKEARPPRVDTSRVATYVGRDLQELQELRRAYLETTYLARLDAGSDAAERGKLARVYYLNRDYGRARDELEQIPLEQRDAALWNNLGNAQLALGELRTALTSYSRARELDRADPGIALNRGLVLHVLGEADLARAELAAAVRLTDGVEAAMGLLGVKAQDTSETRAGEAVALEQLSLKTIEELLREAMEAVPDVLVDVDSVLGTAEADSLTAPGSEAATDSVTQDEGIEGESEEQVPTLAGASRGEQIETASIVDVLYWKNF